MVGSFGLLDSAILFGSIGLLELVDFVGCSDYTFFWIGSRNLIDLFNLVSLVGLFNFFWFIWFFQLVCLIRLICLVLAVHSVCLFERMAIIFLLQRRSC